MNIRAANPPACVCSRSRGGAAFSLVEIMVAVGLLTVIILGLIMMFNQTQQAFQAGTTQTDVLEAGRTAMDLIRSELEQMTPGETAARNFYVSSRGLMMRQALPPTATGAVRTNSLQEFFFLSRYNQDWSGVGYVVSNYATFSTDRVSDGTIDTISTLGTLYRYDDTNAFMPFNPDPVSNFWSCAADVFEKDTIGTYTNLHRVLDGVVHFRVTPYSLDGTTMVPASASDPTNNVLYGTLDLGGDYPVMLFSNVLPAYVDLELGILEPRVIAQYRSIPNAAAQQAFLKRQAGRVHVFRQRIPIRNVDPQAYQ